MARSRPATLAVLALLADYAAGLLVGVVHSVSQRALSTTTTRIPRGYNGMGTPLVHCHRALNRASETTLRSLGPTRRDTYWATTSMAGLSFPGRDVRRRLSGWRLGRPERASAAVMMSGAEGGTGGAGGGTPVGGYPPPEHLHGVFAVYKPQGFSSADAVQKIKNVLTKGVRDEMAARHKLEVAVGKEDGIVDVTLENREALQGGSTGGAQPEVPETEEGLHVDGVEAVSTGGVNRDEGSESNNGEFKARKKKRRGGTQRWKGPKVKVGHGGTLDPMATGVLVIGVGKGCRELGNFLQGGKSYVAEGLFGHETDTQDAEGEATLHAEWGHVTGEAVDRALGPFSGTIMQVPPMFSALHKDGKRLYELARQGVTVEREARPVTIHSLRQVDPPPPLPRLGLELECGGGFYVRTLIEDLARALDTRAHMTALERTKQGPFELEHALRREDWEYDKLCKHLEDTNQRMGRGSVASEESASGPVPAVPVGTAAAVEG